MLGLQRPARERASRRASSARESSTRRAESPSRRPVAPPRPSPQRGDAPSPRRRVARDGAGAARQRTQAADDGLSNLDALPLVERWLHERGKLQAVGQEAPLFYTLKGMPADPATPGTCSVKAGRSGAARASAQPGGRTRTRWRDHARNPATAWKQLAHHDGELPQTLGGSGCDSTSPR